MDYAADFNPNRTPQTDLLPGQVRNNAGGGSFDIGPFEQLRRFLVLGTEGGTYYQRQDALTKQNGRNILACLDEDALATVRLIHEMWFAGRCPRPEPVMFALALAYAEAPAARELIEDRFTEAVRTGYHLFRFVHYVNQFRGWGRALKRMIGRWYLSKNDGALAYQLVKYQRREGWSHRDVLRLAHPRPNLLLGWAAGKVSDPGHPLIRAAAEALDENTNPDRVRELIHEHRLTHEMVNPKHKQLASVWAALMAHMPLGAFIRNLATLTARGVIKLDDWKTIQAVTGMLTDREHIARARIHPMSVLAANRVYAAGQGFRGQQTWTPVPQIIDALDEAFELAFANVESTGKSYLLGVDVSGSMLTPSTLQCVSCREAAAAMALITARTEERCIPMAFTSQFVQLPISKRTTLDALLAKTARAPFGATDCALPMQFAIQNRLEIDTFVVYTDNETWHGPQHPVQALKEYRRTMNRPAKLAVVALTPTKFSIADPNDAGMLDLVGFDSATPQILSEFSKGYS